MGDPAHCWCAEQNKLPSVANAVQGLLLFERHRQVVCGAFAFERDRILLRVIVVCASGMVYPLLSILFY